MEGFSLGVFTKASKQNQRENQMGVKFKEKNTGFIVEFEYDVDIETTRTHPDYEEIMEEVVKKEPVIATSKFKSKE